MEQGSVAEACHDLEGRLTFPPKELPFLGTEKRVKIRAEAPRLSACCSVFLNTQCLRRNRSVFIKKTATHWNLQFQAHLTKPQLARKYRLSLLHSNECNVPSVPWHPKCSQPQVEQGRSVTQGVHGRDKCANHVLVIHNKG